MTWVKDQGFLVPIRLQWLLTQTQKGYTPSLSHISCIGNGSLFQKSPASFAH